MALSQLNNNVALLYKKRLDFLFEGYVNEHSEKLEIPLVIIKQIQKLFDDFDSSQVELYINKSYYIERGIYGETFNQFRCNLNGAYSEKILDIINFEVEIVKLSMKDDDYEDLYTFDNCYRFSIQNLDDFIVVTDEKNENKFDGFIFYGLNSKNERVIKSNIYSIRENPDVQHEASIWDPRPGPVFTHLDELYSYNKYIRSISKSSKYCFILQQTFRMYYL